jgi:hypothetical protein
MQWPTFYSTILRGVQHNLVGQNFMTYEAQNKVLYLEHLLQSAKSYGRLFFDSAVSQNYSTVQ